jgi:hypothetical protein
MAREREIVGILRILRGARGVKLTAKEGKWPAWFRRCRWEEAGVDVPRVRPLGLSPVGRVSAPFRVCRTPVGHLSDTCGTPVGHPSDTCRTRVGTLSSLSDTCWTPVGHLWEPFGLLSDTCGTCGNLSDSCRTPFGNLSETCRAPSRLPLRCRWMVSKVSKVSKYQRYQSIKGIKVTA